MIRKDIYQIIFSLHVSAQRELTMSEVSNILKRRYRVRPNKLRQIRALINRTRALYDHRWHEIYAAKLGIVHEPAPEPVIMAPEPKPEVDPLAALRKARAKKEEEHE